MPQENIAAIYARWLKLQEEEKNDEPKRRRKRRHIVRRIPLNWVTVGGCSFVKALVAFGVVLGS